MTFASLEYVGFLLIVVAAYQVLSTRGQNMLLAVASFVFYGWIHPWYALLLLYSAALDFAVGIGIERWRERRSWLLAVSVVGNLGLLAAFKYNGFFVDAAREALAQVGLGSSTLLLAVALPMGLSFYTFQSLGYSIDVYRGRQPACRDPLTYLVFVSFFPPLLMGPISRARDLLPQVARPRPRLEVEAARSAVTLLLWGAFKKVVIANTLVGFVFTLLSQPDASLPIVWAAGLGASVMMFADFSGYTDIARGSARLLGFDLPENFRAPYLSTTVAEWWSRWHITFYQWMADYVFTPLVTTPWCRRWLVPPFVRVTPGVHAVRGVILTMLLSGLWHGAAWHYLAWGAFMAAVQLTYAFAARFMPRPLREWRWRDLLLRPLLWNVVIVSEILFQVPDLSDALRLLLQSPLGGTERQWVTAFATASLVLTAAAPMVAVWAIRPRWQKHVAERPALLVLETTGWALLGWAILAFWSPAQGEFQYFHF